MSRRRSASALLLAGVLAPQTAAAHSPVPGMAGFYVGLLHPLSTPAPLLALLALGVLLGQAWPLRFAAGWGAFALALVSGLLLARIVTGVTTFEAALLVFAIVAGALAALRPGDRATLDILLAGIGGLLLGSVTAPDPGPLGPSLVTMIGTFFGATIALFYVSGAIGWVRQRVGRPWLPVAFRILAAWITAIAGLMLALAWVSRGVAWPAL